MEKFHYVEHRFSQAFHLVGLLYGIEMIAELVGAYPRWHHYDIVGEHERHEVFFKRTRFAGVAHVGERKRAAGSLLYELHLQLRKTPEQIVGGDGSLRCKHVDVAGNEKSNFHNGKGMGVMNVYVYCLTRGAMKLFGVAVYEVKDQDWLNVVKWHG